MGRFRYIHGAASSVGTSSQGDWHDRSTPAARKCELGTRSKKQKAPPRLAGPRPIGFRRPPAPGAHAAKISNARACPGLRSGEIQWGVGRPAGGRAFFFAAGAQRFFFFAAGARQVHSLTCCPPPPTVHCRKIQGPRRVFFFAAGVRAHSLTHSLPAARSTHTKTPAAKKNAPRTRSNKKNAPRTRSKTKKRARHTQQKNSHPQQKISTLTWRLAV